MRLDRVIRSITRNPAPDWELYKGLIDIMATTLNSPRLHSEEKRVAETRQFRDFGVLDTGRQSKASTASAVILNILILGFVVLLGAAAKKTIDANRKLTMLTMPVAKPVPPPAPPKILPRPLPPTPVVKIEPPKIKLPDVKPIEAPKPTEVKMTQPAPIVTPAAPKKIIAPAAPQVVNLAHPIAASVVNNSQHPTAVALGSPNNPIAPSNRPAVMAPNLGQHGMAGMPASNTGGGPASTTVKLGSGSPGGQSLTGNGVRPVAGVKLGVIGGTGPNNATGKVAGPVNLGQNPPPAVTKATVAAVAAVQTGPKVLFKPKPAYTAEATALHLSGAVALRIRVSATGGVTVLAVTSSLGHGLDESAERAIQGTRFAPAIDANGRPVDWEGVVRVNFESAS